MNAEFCILVPAALEAVSVVADGHDAVFLSEVYDHQLGCHVQRWCAPLGYIHPEVVIIKYGPR